MLTRKLRKGVSRGGGGSWGGEKEKKGKVGGKVKGRESIGGRLILTNDLIGYETLFD